LFRCGRETFVVLRVVSCDLSLLSFHRTWGVCFFLGRKPVSVVVVFLRHCSPRNQVDDKKNECHDEQRSEQHRSLR